eukprot:scaffold42029_cov55-Attheya_sp.AAC.1
MQIEFPAVVAYWYGSIRAHNFSLIKNGHRAISIEVWSEQVSEHLPHYKTPTVNTPGRRCRCDASIIWLHDRTMPVRISRADVSSCLCVPDGALDLGTLVVASLLSG